MDRHEEDMVIKEILEESFDTHANGHAMAKKILRAGYYWLTMGTDYFHYAKNRRKFQIYIGKVHVPPTSLNVLTKQWPFSMWGINMIMLIDRRLRTNIDSYW